ncbi:SgcJ/EcaC family oxidoreductase [Cereibacter sphaeroides]|uniref:SgcJ/EcaC family oxidoreductase n=1 Tax=Cereibacter sphaeroides TaxID=1063 RepID=UPI001F2CD4B1|nr:SgcJ/EcaC family oxidoreductase [Cereibacter sphaeroides]MCE6951640.1 SgcJ/EcaC family oxidoreductase [Cereibacter sphaeroides]
MTPDEFPRRFAALWGVRDAEALADLVAEDGTMLTLTGLWCEGRKEILAALRAELAGAFARSRLVSGKTDVKPLGPGATLLHQRFVLSGLVDAEGRDAGRIGAILTAVLLVRKAGVEAVTLHFTVIEG